MSGHKTCHRACVNPKRNHMHASTCPGVRALQEHANITCVPHIDFRGMCARTQHVHPVHGSPGTRTHSGGRICAHRDERSTQPPRRQNRNMHMHAARVWRMLSADALGCTVSAQNYAHATPRRSLMCKLLNIDGRMHVHVRVCTPKHIASAYYFGTIEH